MNKRYPMLLFPCFRLQDRMQKSTLGESHWLQLHKRLYQKLKLENYQVRASIMTMVAAMCVVIDVALVCMAMPVH